jgi:hypothetical protein
MNIAKLNDDVVVLIYKFIYADVLCSIRNLKKSYLYFIKSHNSKYVDGWNIQFSSSDFKREYCYVDKFVERQSSSLNI